MPRVLTILLAMELAGSSGLAAQQLAGELDHARLYDGPRLSLQEAVTTAAAQNLDVAALRKELDVLKLRPRQERTLPPPMVGAQIWGWPVNTLNPTKTNFYMPMISQELPGRGKRELREALAQREVALGSTDITVRQLEVVTMVKQSYADLVVTRKAIDVDLASVALLRQITDMFQAKYAVGGSSQQDVLKSIAEISTLHDDLLMLDEQEQLAAARLNTLLNRRIDTSIGPLDEPFEQTLATSLDDLRRMAVESAPQVIAARQQVERAQAELAIAKQDYKPDFSVQGGYMVMPNQTDAWLLQGAITWNRAPWARPKVDLHMQETTAEVAAATARLQATESEIGLAIQTAYVRAKTAERRASLLRTTIVPQSEQTLDVSRIGYQAGQADVIGILDTQRMLLTSRLDYYKSLGEFQQALADLEHAVGRDLARARVPIVEGREGIQ